MKLVISILSIIGLLGLGYFLSKELGLIPRYAYLQNFESDEFSHASDYIQPQMVKDGLAIYQVGSGKPVLLLPYPHAHTKEPMAQGPIANLLVEMGRTVITFDVPGAYQSTATAVGDMEEMLTSAEKTLDELGITEPVDVVGHSMSGLVALAFAIEHPDRTRNLVLIGSMSGFPAALKYGMPKSVWSVTEIDYWKFIFLGLKVKSGFGSLADHKALYNIMSQVSFYDQDLFVPMEIEQDDHLQGIPIREIVWGKNIFKQPDYADKLNSLESPTLILVGRHDPEAPVSCSEELDQGIPNSRMVIFEQSGHYPYLEEPEFFIDEITQFLNYH